MTNNIYFKPDSSNKADVLAWIAGHGGDARYTKDDPDHGEHIHIAQGNREAWVRPGEWIAKDRFVGDFFSYHFHQEDR